MALSLRRLLRHETILAVLVVVVLVVLAAQSERFFTADNLLNQGRLMSEVGLVALTMTFVIVTGGIDRSVGSMLGLSAILVGVFWKNVGLALPIAMVLAVGAGGLAGLVNGLIITRFKVPPLIATLATLALYRGLAEGISQSRSVRGYPEWFYALGQRDAAGVPVQVWIMLVAVFVAAGILGLTTFGRATYAVGANETAARFSGVAVDRTRLLVYTASGLMAGLAAGIFVPRVPTTPPDQGTGLELDVITAVVLGGARIFRGQGGILGAGPGGALIPAPPTRASPARPKGDGTTVAI